MKQLEGKVCWSLQNEAMHAEFSLEDDLPLSWVTMINHFLHVLCLAEWSVLGKDCIAPRT